MDASLHMHDAVCSSATLFVGESTEVDEVHVVEEGIGIT